MDFLLEEEDRLSNEPRSTSWKSWVGLGDKSRIETLQQEDKEWSMCEKRFVRDKLREKLDISGSSILSPRLLLLY